MKKHAKYICGVKRRIIYVSIQEDYKDILRLCREKIRRAKAHLELNLATAIKDNIKAFYKHISNRSAEENLHPFLDVGGNIVTKDEENAEVLNAFFTSVFTSKISCSLGTSFLSWKTRMGRRMKPP